MSRIRIAQKSDLAAVERFFAEVKKDLLAREIFQWDDTYPNTVFFTAAIGEGNLHLLIREEGMAGVVVLDEWQHPDWEKIGWSRSDGRYLVIHSLAVHPDYQGKGFGAELLQFCEEFAKAHHYDGIRLDAFAENSAALSLYERHGYTRAGELSFPFKPEGHQLYYCYEKKLVWNH